MLLHIHVEKVRVCAWACPDHSYLMQSSCSNICFPLLIKIEEIRLHPVTFKPEHVRICSFTGRLVWIVQMQTHTPTLPRTLHKSLSQDKCVCSTGFFFGNLQPWSYSQEQYSSNVLEEGFHTGSRDHLDTLRSPWKNSFNGGESKNFSLQSCDWKSVLEVLES